MPILIASGKPAAGGSLDEHGNVHRVIRGRNTANELVVELFEPVPAVRRTALYAGLLER